MTWATHQLGISAAIATLGVRTATRCGGAALALAAITIAVAAPPAVAYPYGPCETVYVDRDFRGSPRVVRETVSFDGARHPFEVLLPSDYRSSRARYPALYLLHGWSMDEDSWLVFTDLEQFTAPFRAGDGAAIVVMPRMRGLVPDAEFRDGRRKWESLLTKAIVPFVDAHFRTVSDRRHRAIAGLSGGAFTTTVYAAHRPDLFAAAGAFSGVADLAASPPAGTAAMFAVDRVINACAGGGPTDPGATGNPARDEVFYHDLNPVDLTANLRGTDLYIANGNGTPCDRRDAEDLANPPSPSASAWQNGEAPLLVLAQDAATRLRQRGASVTTDFGCGIHSWRHWQRMLHSFWGFMFDSFTKPEPATFDHRRALNSFSAFGWTFSADPQRAVEFLDVHNASRDALTLTGSGTERVTTPDLFRPNQRVEVVGARDQNMSIRADKDGRIRVSVDLGPPHPDQQYTLQARLAGQDDPGYFTTRTVRFDPRCTVPRLMGRTFRAARRSARAAGCAIARVRRVRSTRRRPGRVVSQRPRAGVDRPEGFGIAVAVARK